MNKWTVIGPATAVCLLAVVGVYESRNNPTVATALPPPTVFAQPTGPSSLEARFSIERCWEDQARKVHDPATARFIAGACEILERRYEERFGRKP